MGFAWVFFSLVTIAFLSLALLKCITGRENQEFERYLKEIEGAGEWSPFSFFNIMRMLMLVGVAIACSLFVLTVTTRPDLAENGLMLLMVAYIAWCGYAFFSSVIRVDKERSGIAVRALMRAGRVKFTALELPR